MVRTPKRKRGRPARVTADDIVKTERKAEALALRKQGYDYRTIGQTLKPRCSAQNAWKLVASALKDLVPDQAAELRMMMGARLDDLLIGVWERALKGDTFAIADALKIMERQAKLSGLDAPIEQKVEVSVNEAKANLARKLATMAARVTERAAAATDQSAGG